MGGCFNGSFYGVLSTLDDVASSRRVNVKQLIVNEFVKNVCCLTEENPYTTRDSHSSCQDSNQESHRYRSGALQLPNRLDKTAVACHAFVILVFPS